MTFTREDTALMKGVAILMMVFYHMFFDELQYISYEPLAIFKGQTIEYYLSRACNPVAMFLLLGGIGNYYVYNKRSIHTKHTLKRILRLYLHYWLSLLIFLPFIILWVKSEFSFAIKDIVWNITGFNTTWKISNWFLLPYCVVLLCSPVLFKLLDKIGWKTCLSFCALLHAIVLLINHYNNDFIYANRWLFNPLPEIFLLFPFMLGASAAKTNFWGIIDNLKTLPSYALWTALLIIILARCFIPILTPLSIFAFILCILLVSASYSRKSKAAICFLGKHSMNMWFAHWWIWDLVVHSSVKVYSPVVFIVVLLLSIATSLIVDFILKPIEVHITKN